MSPSSPLYFSGDANALGTVSALPCDSFASFVSDVLSVERRLPVTREQFHALAKPERDRLKRQAYITPATFKNETSPRKTGEAVNCNLLCIDIDDAGEAKRLLAQRWDQLLPGIAYVAWHTISSTPEAPRLRVVISAAQIPASRYAEAVRTAAEQLGLTTVTHESLVPVQPMFLPTIFADTPDHPFVYVRRTSRRQPSRTRPHPARRARPSTATSSASTSTTPARRSVSWPNVGISCCRALPTSRGTRSARRPRRPACVW